MVFSRPAQQDVWWRQRLPCAPCPGSRVLEPHWFGSLGALEPAGLLPWGVSGLPFGTCRKGGLERPAASFCWGVTRMRLGASGAERQRAESA